MPLEKPPLTEDEKFELQLQQEQELARLSRNYTILERNRAQFTDSGGKLAKQRKVLDIFQREKKNILTDLSVASDDARIADDKKRSKQLTGLLDEYDDFENEIKMKKAHLKEIDGQIRIVQKKVLDLDSMQITDYQFQQRVVSGEQTVQTLENKLEVQIKKFCAISSENTKLRQEINHLLIERSEFNKIWDKLINNLCIGKKFMLDLIEQATIAYDQREEWVSKLQFLRTKAHNDLLGHIQEMRTIQRKIDNDTKLQEFFATKGQKRIMKDLELKENQKRLKNKNKMKERMDNYRQIMAAIKEFSGEDVIDKIAINFLHQEEENFSLFQYINHMNQEMEEMCDRLGNLHIAIDEQKVLQEMRKSQQGDTLDHLNRKFERIKDSANAKEEELKTVDQKLKTIMNGIGTLFKLFKCKNDPLIKLLGHNDVINYDNVLLYLKILEKNVQQAYVTVFYKDKAMIDRRKMKADQATVKLVRPPFVIEPIERIVAANPCPLCAEHEQVNDVIDVLQHAYDKSQIQVNLKKLLSLEGASEEDRLHNVSACHLPKSRQIIQKRYQ